MTVLEVGCGWGLTLQRAMEKYDVNVIGLTLSKNQQAYREQLLSKIDTDRKFEGAPRGLGAVRRSVDAIVSIEAFEHFGFERYDAFFDTCFNSLPSGGRMTIQSSVGYHPQEMAARGKKLTVRTGAVRQVHDRHKIFPGDASPSDPDDGRSRRQGRLHRSRGAVAAEPLHQDPRHLGRPPGAQQGPGDRRGRRAALPTTTCGNLTGCQYYFIDEAIDVSLVSYVKP